MNAITKLTSFVNDQCVQTELKLVEICKTVDRAVPHANRVSLWKFSDDRSRIKCLYVLDPENGSAQGQVLTHKDYPVYFEHILNNRVIVASDARQHYVTKYFGDAYFVPLNIFSTLDFIVHVDHQPIGIICCESVGQQVNWDKRDKVAIKRIANVMSKYVAERL